MARTRGNVSQTSDDLAHGQIAIITARWIFVLAGMLFAFWNPPGLGELRLQILVILALAAANFYLHAQLLMRRPAIDTVVYLASAVDIGVISLIVLSQGGFDAHAYVFYFLAIAAFSVAFGTAETFFATGVIVLVYVWISLGAAMASEGNQQAILARVLTLTAVAVCGNTYWRNERDRRQAVVQARAATRAEIARAVPAGDPVPSSRSVRPILETRTPAQEAAEDIFFGQQVIIVARWFLIAVATVLILWTATAETELVVWMLPVVVLIALNFYLHGRYLMERPANQALIMAASLVDLVIVTAIVLIGPGQSGLASQFFVLYYPVVLAVVFVFPRSWTVPYAVLAVLAYAGACVLSSPSVVFSSGELEILTRRLVVLLGVAGLGGYYWRIQRDRRRAALGAFEATA